MLDEALEQLGVPLEDRNMEPAVSVEVDNAPADENAIETITGYLCGCCQTVAKERRVSKRPPVAIIRGDGGYDSHEAFPQKTGGVRTIIRIDSNCRAGDVDRARSEAVLVGGGCTAAQFARMGKDERKKHQKEWKVKRGDL